ncbi:MAG: thioredoxin family protein [Planctomycetes bacterium]|nr:thioredoxin family protein [Planctomycetota bacterium]
MNPLAVIVALAAAPANAAVALPSVEPVPTTAVAATLGDEWLTDFAAAKKQAKADGKVILADFTGSDWCGWCIKLHEEVFSTKEFAAWATKNVVLLEVDFPQNKPQSDELKKQNKALQATYKIEGYPTIVFLDGDGKEVGRSGYAPGGPKAWIKEAEAAMKGGAPDQKPAGEADAQVQGDSWLTDFAAAQKLAKKSKKPLLVDFTGSDWCGWCIKLDEEVFSKAEFKTWAAENVVLVKLDFPRKTKLPDELAKQNKELAAKYSIQGYPTILFLDAKGEKIEQSGYLEGGPEKWIADAEKKLGIKSKKKAKKGT